MERDENFLDDAEYEKDKKARKIPYSERLSTWHRFSYRLAYDIGATLAGAIPRAFLRPFEYLAYEYGSNHYEEEWQRRLRHFVKPWIKITEFYIQKPIANLASLIGLSVGGTIGRILSLFSTAPDYKTATRWNSTFQRINPGVFGEYTQPLASWGLWGALFGLAAASMIGQPLLGFAAVGATLGLASLVGSFYAPESLTNWFESKLLTSDDSESEEEEQNDNNDNDAKTDYQKRLNSWRNFSYRLSYDIGASLAGAIPQGFLDPFMSLTKSGPIFESKPKALLRDALSEGVSPWSKISLEYLQRPAGNLASLIGILAAETLGRVLSIFKAAPQYQTVTRDNAYFNPITPGAFGRFVENYAPFAVWGALGGLGLTALTGGFGFMEIQGYTAAALVSSTLGGMAARLVFLDSPKLISYLKNNPGKDDGEFDLESKESQNKSQRLERWNTPPTVEINREMTPNFNEIRNRQPDALDSSSNQLTEIVMVEPQKKRPSSP